MAKLWLKKHLEWITFVNCDWLHKWCNNLGHSLHCNKLCWLLARKLVEEKLRKPVLYILKITIKKIIGYNPIIVAKQFYRKLSFYNIFIYCRNLIYLTYSKMYFILYILWGVGIISSQVFSHLGSFKDWIQTEACVIPSYHGMLIQKQRNK